MIDAYDLSVESDCTDRDIPHFDVSPIEGRKSSVLFYFNLFRILVMHFFESQLFL